RASHSCRCAWCFARTHRRGQRPARSSRNSSSNRCAGWPRCARRRRLLARCFRKRAVVRLFRGRGGGPLSLIHGFFKRQPELTRQGTMSPIVEQRMYCRELEGERTLKRVCHRNVRKTELHSVALRERGAHLQSPTRRVH